MLSYSWDRGVTISSRGIELANIYSATTHTPRWLLAGVLLAGAVQLSQADDPLNECIEQQAQNQEGENIWVSPYYAQAMRDNDQTTLDSIDVKFRENKADSRTYFLIDNNKPYNNESNRTYVYKRSLVPLLNTCS